MARKKPPTVVADSVFDVPPTPTEEEIHNDIIAAVTGGMAVRDAIETCGGNRCSFYSRLGRDEQFMERYTRAKQVSCHAYADDTIAISDEKPEYVTTEDGSSRVDPGFVAWQKNRVEVRKWHLTKLLPKVYGDKVDIDLTASFSSKTDDEIVAEALLIVASLPKGPDGPDA